jgi:hypothetical protein
MNARPSLILGVSIIVSCLIFVVFFGQPSAGQAPAVPAKPERLYQAMPVGSVIVVFDPATGQCWTRLVQGDQIKDDPKIAWVSLGTPIKK